MRRLGASVSLLLLASALPASAAGAKHKAADPRPRQRAKNAQHGARVDPHRDPHVAHAASAKGHVSRFRQLGLASWYGRGFHGHRTASGEHYDMYAMTAAHRTLPLGSYVRVTSLASARSVVVRINDRGPYARGRVIDLSYAAAKMLGLQYAGTAKVKIEGLSRQEAKAAQAEMLAANSNASGER